MKFLLPLLATLPAIFGNEVVAETPTRDLQENLSEFGIDASRSTAVAGETAGDWDVHHEGSNAIDITFDLLGAPPSAFQFKFFDSGSSPVVQGLEDGTINQIRESNAAQVTYKNVYAELSTDDQIKFTVELHLKDPDYPEADGLIVAQQPFTFTIAVTSEGVVTATKFKNFDVNADVLANRGNGYNEDLLQNVEGDLELDGSISISEQIPDPVGWDQDLKLRLYLQTGQTRYFRVQSCWATEGPQDADNGGFAVKDATIGSGYAGCGEVTITDINIYYFQFTTLGGYGHSTFDVECSVDWNKDGFTRGRFLLWLTGADGSSDSGTSTASATVSINPYNSPKDATASGVSVRSTVIPFLLGGVFSVFFL